VLPELLGPPLVEYRPVALQCAHDDAHAHDAGQAHAGLGQDGSEVREQLSSWVAGLIMALPGIVLLRAVLGPSPNSHRHHDA
jgi:hypothetical protein